MLTQDQYLRICEALSILQRANPQLARDFQANAFFVRLPAGTDVFNEGDIPDGLALLISGGVRVYKLGESGREITLYRFGAGESCVMTANAILSRKSLSAIATVEQDADAVIIPADAFRDWVNRYELWREFVFGLLSDRLATIIAIVDEVVFKRMDRRVAALLIMKSAAQEPIRITHQEIAAELGSSREVISRIIEDLSEEGLIKSGRGAIRIISFAGLQSRSVM